MRPSITAWLIIIFQILHLPYCALCSAVRCVASFDLICKIDGMKDRKKTQKNDRLATVFPFIIIIILICYSLFIVIIHMYSGIEWMKKKNHLLQCATSSTQLDLAQLRSARLHIQFRFSVCTSCNVTTAGVDIKTNNNEKFKKYLKWNSHSSRENYRHGRHCLLFCLLLVGCGEIEIESFKCFAHNNNDKCAAIAQ